MEPEQYDANTSMMLDGNALAGVFSEIFSVEMTRAPAECAHCGAVSALGGLWAFTQSPGMVLLCPQCQEVILRLVKTPEAFYIDARGAAYIRMPFSP